MSNWVAIDWGTTNFRAFLLDELSIVDEYVSNHGIKNIENEDFEKILKKNLSKWINKYEQLDIFICGMIGSRQGWIEVPYIKCPCRINNLITKRPFVRDKKLKIHIVSGISQDSPNDLMRGEETILSGFIIDNPNYCGSICIPGTHSKWVQVNSQKIVKFSTFLTGEMFEILCKHSILRHDLRNNNFCRKSFLEGINAMQNFPNELLKKLFHLRARSILQSQISNNIFSLLSGYIIGLELSGSKLYWENKNLVLIGSNYLNNIYEIALKHKVKSLKKIDSSFITIKGLNFIRNLHEKK